MFGSLTRRKRRPLWGWLTVLLLAALAASVARSFGAREEAVREASSDAETLARTELTTLLEPRDLLAPVVGDRATQLTEDVQAQITSVSAIEEVRIYSSIGRILYAADPAIVGTRPSYLRDLTFEVASGDARSQIRSDVLQTLVPIWLSPGGTVVVAELSQPVGPIASEATSGWYLTALVLGLLALGAIGLVAASSRPQPPPIPGVQVYPAAGAAQASPTRTPRAAVPPPAGRPEPPGEATEENVYGVQRQLKEALAKISTLEAQLGSAKGGHASNGAEVEGLREQLRETTDRLNMTELDVRALRERLTLSQRELEEARALAAPQGELEELRKRLERAELRAEEAAQELLRMEGDLEYASDQFHMSKLSEALREIEEGHHDEPPNVSIVTIDGPDEIAGTVR